MDEMGGEANLLVVWMTTPQVSSAVDEPGHVECKNIAKDGSNEESSFEVLTPKIPRYHRWKSETKQYH